MRLAKLMDIEVTLEYSHILSMRYSSCRCITFLSKETDYVSLKGNWCGQSMYWNQITCSLALYRRHHGYHDRKSSFRISISSHTGWFYLGLQIWRLSITHTISWKYPETLSKFNKKYIVYLPYLTYQIGSFEPKLRYLRYLNNNIIKDRCPIPLDATVMLGPLKFNLQATIDHHGPSIDSGHYIASINCCKKNILLQRSQNYGVRNYW